MFYMLKLNSLTEKNRLAISHRLHISENAEMLMECSGHLYTYDIEWVKMALPKTWNFITKRLGHFALQN